MREGREGLLATIMDDVARHGLEDRSLRQLADAVGTSHRMVIYHFGSRAGLVDAIVREVEARERALVRKLAGRVDTPADLVKALWEHLVAPDVLPFVRLFFELVAVTARDGSRTDLTAPWLSDAGPISDQLGARMSSEYARVCVAVVRGLLVDVLTTGDVKSATRAVDAFIATLPSSRSTTRPSPDLSWRRSRGT